MALFCDSKQIGSGQDYAVCGRIGAVDYIAVLDGHGNDACIRHLRQLNFDEIATSEKPIHELEKKLKGYNLYKSGSTVTFARIVHNIIQVFNLGDSKTIVLINGVIVYKTEMHTFHNEEELIRVKPYVTRICESMAPFPVSETVVKDSRSDVGVFLNGETLVPSQSLGHNNMTGPVEPTLCTMEFNPKDKVRVICGSDGFWDMYMENSPLLVCTPKDMLDEAERRWKQIWTYITPVGAVRTAFPNADDVSIAVWDNF